MKKKMSKKKTIGIFAPCITVVAAAMALILTFSMKYSDTISLFLYGRGSSSVDPSTLSKGSDLCEDIVEEGTVLLKNENNALPLTSDEAKKVNVFGWAGYDWMTSTFGSGFSNTSLKKQKLFPALEDAGIEYNETLYKMYHDFYSASTIGSRNWGKSDWDEYRGDVDVGTTKKFILREPGASFYTDSVIQEATSFSDVALVVIGRTGGEAADLRFEQEKQVQENQSSSTKKDTTRSYLQLSTEEEEMIAAAKKACSKVVVLLNVSNTMELGFLNDEGIDAAMLVGLTGLTGVNSVIDLLKGENEEGGKVSPSGRTADTYAYSISSAPSSVNSGYGGAQKYTNAASLINGITTSNYKKGYYDAYLDYYEGIYVGYRYYETADEEGYIDYDQTVQYPFGYGLSYTQFEWSIEGMLINDKSANFNNTTTLGKEDSLEICVNVKNVGDYPSKDVVELYYSAPYTSGGIEKSSVVLGAFAKTEVIEPGETKQITLKMSVQDMASYDCYDKNNNGHTGYELDGGTYTLSLRTNSHEVKDSSNTLRFTIPSSGYNYDTDSKTGNIVKNRFTGNDTIDGYPLDGSKEKGEITYLSRSDFGSTFPKEKVIRACTDEALSLAREAKPNSTQLEKTGYGSITTKPLTGNVRNYTVDDLLDAEDYDDPIFESAISQLSTSELFNLIRNGYFKTAALESLGKPEFADLDGPLGLNTRVTSNTTCSYVSYPSETLMAQTWNTDLAYALGLSVGKEARGSEGVRGWYGPAANIHRNPYGGRNAEYYSEDGLLSGKFAAETIRGAKNAGLYCYMKHFVANDSESLREGVYTFMTEQTFREIYLKPYELAVKEGGANALMTSMNRIGATWAGASYALCHDILREEWGFRGTLVTDWVDTMSRELYMPVYKGIWAGNSIWLNNADNQKMFSDSDYTEDPVFITLAQNVAHDVLWTMVDTNQTYASYDPDADVSLSKGGFTYNRSWIQTILVPIEVVLGLGLGVLVFFMIWNLKGEKKEETQPETKTE